MDFIWSSANFQNLIRIQNSSPVKSSNSIPNPNSFFLLNFWADFHHMSIWAKPKLFPLAHLLLARLESAQGPNPPPHPSLLFSFALLRSALLARLSRTTPCRHACAASTALRPLGNRCILARHHHDAHACMRCLHRASPIWKLMHSSQPSPRHHHHSINRPFPFGVHAH